VVWDGKNVTVIGKGYRMTMDPTACDKTTLTYIKKLWVEAKKAGRVEDRTKVAVAVTPVTQPMAQPVVEETTAMAVDEIRSFLWEEAMQVCGQNESDAQQFRHRELRKMEMAMDDDWSLETREAFLWMRMDQEQALLAVQERLASQGEKFLWWASVAGRILGQTMNLVIRWQDERNPELPIVGQEAEKIADEAADEAAGWMRQAQKKAILALSEMDRNSQENRVREMAREMAMRMMANR
jgi:hypothetical protein